MYGRLRLFRMNIHPIEQNSMWTRHDMTRHGRFELAELAARVECATSQWVEVAAEVVSTYDAYEALRVHHTARMKHYIIRNLCKVFLLFRA